MKRWARDRSTGVLPHGLVVTVCCCLAACAQSTHRLQPSTSLSGASTTTRVLQAADLVVNESDLPSGFIAGLPTGTPSDAVVTDADLQRRGVVNGRVSEFHDAGITVWVQDVAIVNPPGGADTAFFGTTLQLTQNGWHELSPPSISGATARLFSEGDQSGTTYRLLLEDGAVFSDMQVVDGTSTVKQQTVVAVARSQAARIEQTVVGLPA